MRDGTSWDRAMGVVMMGYCLGTLLGRFGLKGGLVGESLWGIGVVKREG